MEVRRSNILVIAGYDPCGGAGILADVKTAEQHNVYAYAICTGYTFQHSTRISHIQWFSKTAISRQIALCYEDTGFDWVKLGIVRNHAMLSGILRSLRKHQPLVKVIWDPVLSSSSGVPFMKGLRADNFETILPQVFMVTPNLPEIRMLYPFAAPEETCRRLSEKTIIYLKGGHDETSPGLDRLFIRGDCHMLTPGTKKAFSKHGSGCVLSAALAANLARETGPMCNATAAAAVEDSAAPFAWPPPRGKAGTVRREVPERIVLSAAIRSKRYTEAFLNSDPGLLGWHQRIKHE